MKYSELDNMKQVEDPSKFNKISSIKQRPNLKNLLHKTKTTYRSRHHQIERILRKLSL